MEYKKRNVWSLSDIKIYLVELLRGVKKFEKIGEALPHKTAAEQDAHRPAIARHKLCKASRVNLGAAHSVHKKHEVTAGEHFARLHEQWLLSS